METMGWSWEELMTTPEFVYISTTRILNLRNKEMKKKQSNVKMQR